MAHRIDPERIDPAFRALPLARLADAALGRARELGAEHVDVRVERIVAQSVELRDAGITGVVDSSTEGLAVRVLVDGTWGFASHVELTPERAAATAERAVGVARALAPLARERVDRAAEPVYAGVEWCSDYLVDPLAVPTGDKVALLATGPGACSRPPAWTTSRRGSPRAERRGRPRLPVGAVWRCGRSRA
jgi:TldD protein